MQTENDAVSRDSFWKTLSRSCGTGRDRRNQLIFTGWMFAWGISWIAAQRWLQSGKPDGAVAWLITVSPLIFAALALYYYLRFLRQTDEMVRRIQVEGLAFGFGIGVFYMLAIQIFQAAEILHGDIADATAVMFISWAVGIVLGTWRYR
ncbi:MAG: hypothetical protein KJO55_01790 [Gammaproteobacteria bacterium]|nr:hypothetical protein [Gammaproteobacteria bacterium]